MNWLEIVGTIIGIIYLYLEYRASVWLWVASIAMPAIYLFVYYDAGLYADFGISIYYLIASVYGLCCWLKKHEASGNENPDDTKIIHTPPHTYVRLLAAAITLFIVIGYILREFTDSTVPWADGFTTALSIVAMWMLAKKYVEQWLVWIVADIACSALYAYKELWFTSVLYAAYAVIAVLGYRKWKKLMTNNIQQT
ncbi:MAG: nicotinamide mononucleotide transporter [Bacteroides sp.]|nr:nicotinamide mononucleotide transporter [Bacteroides sp.]